MCSIPGLPTPGSEVHVVITRVKLNPSGGPVELWVNMADDRKHIYRQMREEIQIHERMFNGPEGKPGDLCLAHTGDSWHRARIVSVEGDTYRVFLIDQGRTHEASADALAWARSDSVLLPPEMESCILANVVTPKNQWPEGAANFLESLPGKKVKGLVQHVLADRKILLDVPFISKLLCDFGVPQSVAGDEFRSLVRKCLDLPTAESPAVDEVTQEQDFKYDKYFYPEVSTGVLENITVTEITDPQNIYCQLLIFTNALKNLSERIHSHYEENPIFDEAQPQTVGDPCATRDQIGRWRRSLLKQNIGDGDGAIEVFHVDEGRTEMVPVGDVRPLRGEFLRMPVVTYQCRLHGPKEDDPDWTTDQIDHLKSLLLNKTLAARFDRHESSQHVYYVTLFADRAKARLFPSSEDEQESRNQNESISFLLESEGCTNGNNQVPVNGDSHDHVIQEIRNDDVSVSGNNEMQLLDPRTHNDGHVSPGFLYDLQNACENDVFIVGSSIDVKVSCIESPQRFWCQSADKLDSLRRLMHDLQNHYASAHPLPIVESTCIARNPNNDMWYRARMVATQDSPLVAVRFIDYGDTGTVPLRDVRPIDPVFLRLNAQAFQCCLFDPKNPCDPAAGAWTNEALTEFQKFVESEAGLKCIVKAVTSDEEGLLLNMVDIESPATTARKILDQICSRDKTDAGEGSVSQAAVETYNYSTIEVGTIEKVLVTCCESVNYFYCQLDRNSNVLRTVTENVTKLIAQEPYSVRPLGLNSICFAKYTDSSWYRGLIVEKSPKLRVQFVDYGETLAVSESDLRPFPSGECLAKSAPVQAFALGLFDVPDAAPQEVNRWFSECATNSSLTISVVSRGPKGKLLVELFDRILNVNAEVRKRISKLAQLTMVAQVQRLPNPPEENRVLHEERDEHINVSTDLTTEAKNRSLKKVGRQTSDVSPVSPADKANSTFILGGCSVSDAELLVPHPGSHLTNCAYKWPTISQIKTEEVFASCIVDPQYFWCQYTNTADLNTVSALAEEAGRVQQDVAFLDTLGPGSPCLALFATDNKWYRAWVVQRTDNNLQVVFVDYGNEADLDFKDVRPLPQKLVEMVPQAFLCSLNGFDLSRGTWDDQVYDEFYNILVDKPLRVTVFHTEGESELKVPQYSVRVECEKVVVNDEMQKHWKPVSEEQSLEERPETGNPSHDELTDIQDGHTDSSGTNVDANSYMYQKPKISINQTENVYASCIVEPKFFWCQYANTEDLGTLSILSQEEGQLEQDAAFPGTLGRGSPCLAQFPSDQLWYRAQVMEKTDDSLHVVFIDYGNECDVDRKNVRAMSQNLLEMVPQAFLCSLNGFDESKGTWDGQVYDDFYNLLVDKPLSVTVLNVKDHPELKVPSYAVEVENEDGRVNIALLKHWKSVSVEQAKEDRPELEHSIPKETHNVSRGKASALVFKEPKVSMNQTEKVYASCIVEPKHFWCQYASGEEMKLLAALTQEAGETLQEAAFPEALGIGSPCLTLFSDDNRWYRAQVTARTDDILRVVFVDYGNTFDADVKNVKPLPLNLLDMAPQAFLCSLNGFHESKGTWDEQVVDDLYNLLVDKPLSLTVLKMEDHTELRVPLHVVEVESENGIVNTALLKYWRPASKDAAAKERPDKGSPLQNYQTDSNKAQRDAFVYKKPKMSLNQTENVYASCIVEPGFFWCQFADSEELQRLSTLAQEAGRTQQDPVFPETLAVGTPCLALFPDDSQWYRAQVTARTDAGLHVVFVDYGNECDVGVGSVRQLPSDLLAVAPQAFLCSLDGFDGSKGAWDEQVYDDFYELLADKPLSAMASGVRDHVELRVPQFILDIRCKGAAVDALMRKHWKSFQTGTGGSLLSPRQAPVLWSRCQGDAGANMTELHQAASVGDCDAVEEILRQKRVSPNERDLEWSNKTPLHWAAAAGHTETARVLLEHGARPCLRTLHGQTAAHLAAEYGHLGVLRLLHSCHAPLDQEDDCRDTPARIAHIYGHQDCAHFLHRAAVECQAYREWAAQVGVSLDDSDEQWQQRRKQKEENSSLLPLQICTGNTPSCTR